MRENLVFARGATSTVAPLFLSYFFFNYLYPEDFANRPMLLALFSYTIATLLISFSSELTILAVTYCIFLIVGMNPDKSSLPGFVSFFSVR